MSDRLEKLRVTLRELETELQALGTLDDDTREQLAAAAEEIALSSRRGKQKPTSALKADESLQGRLTDFATGAPMGGVTLSFGVDALDLRTTTDGSGTFAIDVPAGRVSAAIDGQVLADLAVRVGGPAFRGDLLGNGGTCDSRYGVVADALSFQPVAGATVSLGGRSMVTGADGWYRIDLGCVYDPYNNSSTTLMHVTHAAYREFSRVLGRGIHGVNRIDAELLRP